MWEINPVTKSCRELVKLPNSVGDFFLDSGAHALYTKKVIKRKAEVRKEVYDWYERDGKITKEFKAYLKSYVSFIKRFGHKIDYYANVDVIFNPELSYKVLKLLEGEGLMPVPVIHYGTSMKWIKKHLDEGYDLIGLGGLGQEVTKSEYYSWADQAFSLIAPESNNRRPLVRTHGFAMTAYDLMTRYPWWGVDSSSWLKYSAYGMIVIPWRYKGEFCFSRRDKASGKKIFDISPSSYFVSSRFDKTVVGKPHQIIASNSIVDNFEAQTRAVKFHIESWLDEIGVPLGKVSAEGEMLEYGVMSSLRARAEANLIMYQRLEADIGPYENRTFDVRLRKGFDL